MSTTSGEKSKFRISLLHKNESAQEEADWIECRSRLKGAAAAVLGNIRKSKDATARLLEYAFMTWDKCRLNEYAKDCFRKECAELGIKAATQSGEFLIYIRYSISIAALESRNPLDKEAAEDIEGSFDYWSRALIGVKA